MDTDEAGPCRARLGKLASRFGARLDQEAVYVLNTESLQRTAQRCNAGIKAEYM